MKILIATQQPIPHEGGLSTHLLDLMAGLKGLGHDVRLVHGGQAASSTFGRLVDKGLSLGSRDRYRARQLRRQYRKLRQVLGVEIARFSPDIMHCHDAYASAAVSEIVGNGPIPIVQTVHGPALYEVLMDEGGPRPRLTAAVLDCERRSFARADMLIPVDDGQAEILRRDYGLKDDRIQVIFNCVNVEEVRKLASAESPLMPTGPFFLVPRRLVLKTGVRYAIEAMPLLKRTDVTLVIGGDGPLRADLESLTAQLGLSQRVRFLGSVPRGQLLPLFRRAEGVIVPSIPAGGVIEATSLAVTEAMAAGSIPIASAIGGLAQLIQDHQTGLLVPPGDPAALAGAMTSVLEDEDLRSHLRSAATKKVEDDYSTTAWLRKVQVVYQRAAAKRQEKI